MKNNILRNKFFAGIFFSVMAVISNGCIPLVVGSMGVLGGYVISPDTVEGVYSKKPFEEVWTAAVEVVSVMGMVEEKNKAGGIIISKISGAKVTVTVLAVGSQSSKMTVKARKAFLPKIRTAQDVYLKIEKYLYAE